MSNYYKIMAEPLPNSKDFGFEPPEDWRKNADALIDAAEEFKKTVGYYRWQIAQCEWSIRRLQAEIDHLADSRDAYAEYVRHSHPHAIRHERERINECLAKIIEIEGRAA